MAKTITLTVTRDEAQDLRLLASRLGAKAAPVTLTDTLASLAARIGRKPYDIECAPLLAEAIASEGAVERREYREAIALAQLVAPELSAEDNETLARISMSSGPGRLAPTLAVLAEQVVSLREDSTARGEDTVLKGARARLRGAVLLALVDEYGVGGRLDAAGLGTPRIPQLWLPDKHGRSGPAWTAAVHTVFDHALPWCGGHYGFAHLRPVVGWDADRDLLVGIWLDHAHIEHTHPLLGERSVRYDVVGVAVPPRYGTRACPHRIIPVRWLRSVAIQTIQQITRVVTHDPRATRTNERLSVLVADLMEWGRLLAACALLPGGDGPQHRSAPLDLELRTHHASEEEWCALLEGRAPPVTLRDALSEEDKKKFEYSLCEPELFTSFG